MNYQILRDEIDTDPEVRGYSGMSNAEIAVDMNLEYETEDKESMTSSAVYNSVNSTEFGLLTADQQQEVWDILHMGTINPFGREATRFIAIFGGGSTTISQLAADRVFPVSRGIKIGIGPVKEGDVEKAMAI